MNVKYKDKLVWFYKVAKIGFVCSLFYFRL